MTKPFDVTKPVQTRDGRKARIICTDHTGDTPIITLVTNSQDVELVYYHNLDGICLYNSSRLNLINIPERRSIFRNIYREGSTGNEHLSLESAQRIGKKDTLEFIYEDDVLVDVKLHRKDQQ